MKKNNRLIDFSEFSIEESLAYCLEQIQQGKAVKEDCLALFPAHKQELSTLLDNYLSIASNSKVFPSPEFVSRGRQEIINQIKQNQPVTFSGSFRTIQYRLEQTFKWRFKMIQIILVTLLALSAITGGAVYASDNSEPGDFLHGLDLAVEQLQLRLSSSDKEAAQLHLLFAIERLDEARGRLTEEDIENTEIALDLYGEEISALAQLVGGTGGADQEALTELVNAALSIHQIVLTGLLDVVPEQAKGAIQNALERSYIQFENLPGPPEGKGPPEGVGNGEDPGPPENAGPPDGAGKPDFAGPPENVPGLMFEACVENISEEDLLTLQQLAEEKGIELQALLRMYCAAGTINHLMPLLPEAAINHPGGGPPAGIPAGGRP
jgi:hypothetical protein